jgi:serine/threonine protein kinase
MTIKSKEEPPSTSLWPNEVKSRYELIGTLGKGAFATVSLAKRKFDSTAIPDMVAIKLVRAHTNTENNYAHREVKILQELNHSNIVKLIEYWEHDHLTDAVAMILDYAKGKTLEFVLKNVGAPSLSFCRVIVAQLVDAVAYLHSVCIMHFLRFLADTLK